MSAAFELFVDEDGQYRFRLRAANGEIVAQSEGYTTKESALAGTVAVRASAAAAEVEDTT